MKKLRLGPHDHRIMSRTTVRLVSQVDEYRFRTHRLVIRARPADAKLLVIDVHAGKDALVPSMPQPIPVQRFAGHADARRDGPVMRHVDVARGTEVWVVVASLDERDTHVTAWIEQLEAQDLS